jgi:RNA-directed DNA polymerase
MKAQGFRMVRYADDYMVLCKSAAEANGALVEVQSWVEANGLTLHPDKTHVGDCRLEGQGFEFLGYRFEAGKRWVRKKSLQALRERIRRKTGRSRGDSLETVIANLNPTLMGWFGYFKHAESYVFKAMEVSSAADCDPCYASRANVPVAVIAWRITKGGQTLSSLRKASSP